MNKTFDFDEFITDDIFFKFHGEDRQRIEANAKFFKLEDPSQMIKNNADLAKTVNTMKEHLSNKNLGIETINLCISSCGVLKAKIKYDISDVLTVQVLKTIKEFTINPANYNNVYSILADMYIHLKETVPDEVFMEFFPDYKEDTLIDSDDIEKALKFIQEYISNLDIFDKCLEYFHDNLYELFVSYKELYHQLDSYIDAFYGLIPQNLQQNLVLRHISSINKIQVDYESCKTRKQNSDGKHKQILENIEKTSKLIHGANYVQNKAALDIIISNCAKDDLEITKEYDEHKALYDSKTSIITECKKLASRNENDTCKVCYENKIDQALICSHVICKTCYSKLPQSNKVIGGTTHQAVTCPFCRKTTRIAQIRSLIFS